MIVPAAVLVELNLTGVGRSPGPGLELCVGVALPDAVGEVLDEGDVLDVGDVDVDGDVEVVGEVLDDGEVLGDVPVTLQVVPDTAQALGVKAALPTLLATNPKLAVAPVASELDQLGPLTLKPPVIGELVASQIELTVLAVVNPTCHGLSALPESFLTLTAT